MPEWLWYAVLGINLGSTVACWYTIVWYWRRLRADEHACFLRWKAIEEQQTRAWLLRMREGQAACPFCGFASAEDCSDPT
jgi:hypothetical protein